MANVSSLARSKIALPAAQRTLLSAVTAEMTLSCMMANVLPVNLVTARHVVLATLMNAVIVTICTILWAGLVLRVAEPLTVSPAAQEMPTNVVNAPVTKY